jgi:hypothetical protein
LDLDYRIAAGVIVATAATDAAYVMFTSAVVTKRAFAAANMSGICICFPHSPSSATRTTGYTFVSPSLARGSGAFFTLKYFNREPSHPPAPLKPDGVAKVCSSD